MARKTQSAHPTYSLSAHLFVPPTDLTRIPSTSNIESHTGQADKTSGKTRGKKIKTHTSHTGPPLRPQRVLFICTVSKCRFRAFGVGSCHRPQGPRGNDIPMSHCQPALNISISRKYSNLRLPEFPLTSYLLCTVGAADMTGCAFV